MFRFEKLDAWREAIALAGEVYDATREFPREEQFGLTSQLRRAAVSISSNIAEGTGRASDTDFTRFVGIAYGSLMEVVSQLHVAKRQGFISEGVFQRLYSHAEKIARILSGLRSKLNRPNP